MKQIDPSREVREKLLEVFEEAYRHDGFGEFRVEMKILKRRQKEVIIHFGKQYRFLVDYDNERRDSRDASEKHDYRQRPQAAR